MRTQSNKVHRISVVKLLIECSPISGYVDTAAVFEVAGQLVIVEQSFVFILNKQLQSSFESRSDKRRTLAVFFREAFGVFNAHICNYRSSSSKKSRAFCGSSNE